MPSVFLSPSTQEWNPYITGGNEEEYMNLIADKMEPYLLSSGIVFARNNPANDVRGAIRLSNELNLNVHLALHSNAGGGVYAGRLRGIDIYYSPYSYESERLATIISNNFEYIYPNPENVGILPTTSLGEVTQTRSVAVLCEIGYHDNYEDATWITGNLDAIAVNLVQSLCDYFGIPFIEASTPYTGTVSTDGSNLNIRSLPTTNSTIIGSIPDGATVTIFGESSGWYVVRYNFTTGYVLAEYVVV